MRRKTKKSTPTPDRYFPLSDLGEDWLDFLTDEDEDPHVSPRPPFDWLDVDDESDPERQAYMAEANRLWEEDMDEERRQRWRQENGY